MNQKPLFIPLKKQHHLEFESGTKTVEYRKYGPRWNERTCAPGRPAILSYGYKTLKRMSGVIKSIEVGSQKPKEFIDIYGYDGECIAIEIQVIAKYTSPYFRMMEDRK